MNNGLIRKLGWVTVAAIIIADMVGTGIFTTSGLVMENVASPLMLIILWGIAGIIALSGALFYAELSTVMHYAGKNIYIWPSYFTRSGVLSGWTSFITGSSAPFAAIAIGMSEYMLEALPAIATDQTILGFSGTLFLKKGIAVLTILIFTFIHLQGVKSGSKIHNVLTVLKILLILGIIISAFSLGEGSFSHFKYSESYDFNLQGIKI